MRAPLLSVRGLEVRFAAEGLSADGVVQAVSGVSLDLFPGRTLGLVGESGSGKSATALAIMGLLPASAEVTGAVRLGGVELQGLSDKAMSRYRGKDLAMVFQDPLSSLTPVFTVGAQIVEALAIHNPAMSRKAKTARAVELLTMVGIPQARDRLGAFPHEFSGGMRQRVTIAMAIANDPRVLIVDEPTTALDATIQAQVLEVLHTAQQETGAALLLITHDLGVVAAMADDVMVMRGGEPVENGPAGEIYNTPQMPYTKELLADARALFDPRPAPPLQDDPAGRKTVLKLADARKHFPLLKGTLIKRRIGTVKALDGVSFDIREGECLSLVGESGAGKTTTLLEIMERRKGRPDEVQLVFQDPTAALDPRFTAFEVLAEPLQNAGMAPAAVKERVLELMRLVALPPDHLNRFPNQLSGGQRQRIGIARALALNPKLVILDEPVSALDVSVQAGIIRLLARLRAELGLSYLLVAHDLSVVRRISDRVAVMYLGKIVEMGDVGTVFGSPRHPYTRALLSAIPIPDPAVERSRQRIILNGEPPGPLDVPQGCNFASRCPIFAALPEAKKQTCLSAEPPLAADTGTSPAGEVPRQEYACFFPDDSLDMKSWSS